MSLDTSSSAIHLQLPPTSSSMFVSPTCADIKLLTIIYSRPPSQITVHPSVIAQILIHHSRHPADSESTRVIGALMGNRSDNGQEVDIRSCFAVPHTEQGQQISVDRPFQQDMVNFLAKNGTKEVIVGWYASQKTVNSNSAIIQEYFSFETNPYPAVHLTVDTEIEESGKGLGVKGWVSQPLGLTSKSECSVFVPVPVSIKYADSERAACESYISFLYKSFLTGHENSGPSHRPPTNSFPCSPPSPHSLQFSLSTVFPYRPMSSLRPIRQQRFPNPGCRGWPIPLGRPRQMVCERK